MKLLIEMPDKDYSMEVLGSMDLCNSMAEQFFYFMGFSDWKTKRPFVEPKNVPDEVKKIINNYAKTKIIDFSPLNNKKKNNIRGHRKSLLVKWIEKNNVKAFNLRDFYNEHPIFKTDTKYQQNLLKTIKRALSNGYLTKISPEEFRVN